MRSCLLLLIAALTTATAADVELALTNGRTVRGEVVTESDASIVLRSRFPARGGVKQVESSYAKPDILKRKDLPGVTQQYEERAKNTPDTVPEQCTLAQWAYENCLREQAKTHAVRVLSLDPENAWARRILDNCGFMEVEGAWVDEAEHLKANGLVRVDGEIMVAGLADARKAYQRARAAYLAAKRKVEETRAIATEKPRSAAAAEAKAKESTAGIEAAKKAIEEAEAQLATAREEPAAKGDSARKERQDRINAAQQAVTTAKQKQRDVKDAADKAKQTANTDKAAGERAKATLADQETVLAKAEADMKEAATKLPADDPLLKEEAAPPEEKVADKSASKQEEKAPEPEKPKVRRLRAGGGD
jgi:hypothetical protein